MLRSTISSNRLKGEASTNDKNTANAIIKKKSTMCAPNNMDMRKLVFLEKECEKNRKTIE